MRFCPLSAPPPRQLWVGLRAAVTRLEWQGVTLAPPADLPPHEQQQQQQAEALQASFMGINWLVSRALIG